ncbi:MAG: aminotransferase class V-fold PLP-dependent enzyme [bacterium]
MPPHRAALGDRALFPDLAWRIYLNHAAISPSAAVRHAVDQAITALARHGVGAFAALHAQRQRLKTSLARLIGAAPEDIALVPNTTQGLSALALCQPWQPGDHLVVFTGEFPTNVTPWQQAAAAFAARVIALPIDDLARPDGPDYTRLDAALARGVRVVALSAVQFQTGLRAPLAAIAERCHAHGARLAVDGIQAIGSVPLDVVAEDIDYLVCGGHKWLMGLEGAGFAWARPDAARELVPRVAGWMSHQDPTDFLFAPGKLRYDKPIRTRLDFLEGGAQNAIGYAGLEAAVHAIEQIGLEAITAHITHWHDHLEPALIDRGFTSRRAPDKARRSAILSALPPTSPPRPSPTPSPPRRRRHHPRRPPPLLPHWPNPQREIPEVIAALDEAITALRA